MPAIRTKDLNLWYGDFQALFDVDIDVKSGKVTSLIGPSGCGKSTYLRAVNRINERLGYVRTTGAIEVMGQNVLAEEVELTQLRREVGMVFQRPNPLPLSIRDNVLFAYRLHRGWRGSITEGFSEVLNVLRQYGSAKWSQASRFIRSLWARVKDRSQELEVEGDQAVEEAPPEVLLWEEVKGGLQQTVLIRILWARVKGRLQGLKAEENQVVETALREVLLWDKVKDRLQQTATELSLEEQQKLCIARLLPVKPSVLLMDEPCSALDPEATKAVEELIWKLRGDYSILIVTHNMAQARRASDECIFMLMGKVIEHSRTGDMFVTPQKKETADYIEGRYG